MPDIKMRLDKAVAHNFGVSRASAGKLIKAGEIEVDGEVITDATYKILSSQVITWDENDIAVDEAFKKRVFMLNKPMDMVCADRDRNNRIVLSLFGDENRNKELHCVGRLDIDTTGLILVTDDGDLNHRITSPKKAVEKEYRAAVKNELTQKDIEHFARGLKHPEEDDRYLPAILKIVSPHEALVTVTEGRFHEVKRLFECVGNEVIELHRVRIGGLLLDDSLEEGEYRELDQEDIDSIFQK